jgi:sugar phosphate isomerase/epimerase
MMKPGLVVCGPDVSRGPLALLSGTFEEKVQKAAQLGYRGIELMVRDPAFLDRSVLKAVVAASGLEVPQVVTGELFGADGLCLVTADKELRQRALARTRAVIELAAELGAMVNIGRLRGRLSFLGGVADPWAVAAEQLREAIAFAAREGVKITLEPLNRYETDFIYTAADGLQMIEMLGYPNVGLMLDTFHMNIEEPSLAAALRTAGDRLWHVHIADSHRRYPGSGHLDFDTIFSTLYELGYQGYVSAELLPLPDPDTAAQKTIEFLKVHIGASGMKGGQFLATQTA